MIKNFLYALCVLGIIVPIHPAHTKPLVADISSHTITIHSAFHGTQLMLFGARNDAGDVVVVVRGPEKRAIVRKKERVGGIWINKTTEKFDNVPSFYAIKASKPYKDIIKSKYFDALGIGENTAIAPLIINDTKTSNISPQRAQFQEALLRYLHNASLYDPKIGSVSFIEETLFKTTIPFPDGTPRGTYTAEVYLFSDGELVGSYTAPIDVVKIGLDAFIFESAHTHSIAYGIAAIAMAITIGGLSNALFRRI